MSGPTTVDIFALQFEVRYDIFKRVLAVPEPLYLFQDPGCPLEAFMPNKPYAWLALLHTSRRISYDARTVLYTNNALSVR
jgi:hypothetical protein